MTSLSPGTGLCLALLLLLGFSQTALAQPVRAPKPVVDPSRSPYRTPPDLEVLTDKKWDAINASVDRALGWLANQQDPEGSYPTHIGGQPGVTALATLAYLSAGRMPGEGPDGAVIDKGIDYVLESQRPDGMFLVDSTNMAVTQWDRGAHTGLYNHAVSSLMLCEAYGLVDVDRQQRIKTAIEKAIKFARKMQTRTQPFPDGRGGFRYFKSLNRFAGKGDSDLSVTGWFVMFYRAAKNAGFQVPKQYIDEAIAYVRRCYDPPTNAFYYGLHGHDRGSVGRAMTGAGLMCLTAAGESDEEMARAAGNWILRHPFDDYGETFGWYDRFHYGAYYCSQAMLQLGGEYWARFYPTLADTLIESQKANGCWPPEQAHGDSQYGSTYTTAITVLTLTAPHQLLPIHQR